VLDRIGFSERAQFRGPRIAIVTTANPAANAEFTTTIPLTEAWQLLSVTVNLVETVQTPWPSLTIKDASGTLVFQSQAGTAVRAATNTSQITWGAGLPQFGATADTVIAGNLPENLLLGPGFVIASLTAGIGANCDYGAASLLVVKYT